MSFTANDVVNAQSPQKAKQQNPYTLVYDGATPKMKKER